MTLKVIDMFIRFVYNLVLLLQETLIFNLQQSICLFLTATLMVLTTFFNLYFNYENSKQFAKLELATYLSSYFITRFK